MSSLLQNEVVRELNEHAEDAERDGDEGLSDGGLMARLDGVQKAKEMKPLSLASAKVLPFTGFDDAEWSKPISESLSETNKFITIHNNVKRMQQRVMAQMVSMVEDYAEKVVAKARQEIAAIEGKYGDEEPEYWLLEQQYRSETEKEARDALFRGMRRGKTLDSSGNDKKVSITGLEKRSRMQVKSRVASISTESSPRTPRTPKTPKTPANEPENYNKAERDAYKKVEDEKVEEEKVSMYLLQRGQKLANFPSKLPQKEATTAADGDVEMGGMESQAHPASAISVSTADTWQPAPLRQLKDGERRSASEVREAVSKDLRSIIDWAVTQIDQYKFDGKATLIYYEKQIEKAQERSKSTGGPVK